MSSARVRFGRAWLGLTLVLGLHVFDEAMTGFLALYNPIVGLLWPVGTRRNYGAAVDCVVALAVPNRAGACARRETGCLRGNP
jgi:hypothetical protein